jgi:hypothetical protein
VQYCKYLANGRAERLGMRIVRLAIALLFRFAEYQQKRAYAKLARRQYPSAPAELRRPSHNTLSHKIDLTGIGRAWALSRVATVWLGVLPLGFSLFGCAGDPPTAPVPSITQPSHVEVQYLLVGFGDSVPNRTIARMSFQAAFLASQLASQARAGANFDSLVKADSDGNYPGVLRIANTAVPLDSAEAPRGQYFNGFTLVAFNLSTDQVGIAPYHPRYDYEYCPTGWYVIKRLR